MAASGGRVAGERVGRAGLGPRLGVVVGLAAVLALLVAGAPAGWLPAGAQPVATATSTATATRTGSSTGQPVPPPTPNGPVRSRGVTGRAAAAGPGAVLAWGYNLDGQLGDGTNLATSTAVGVQGLTGVTGLAPGATANHAVAVRRDGSAVAWGNNSHGQLGDGTTADRNVPVRVAVLPVGSAVFAVAAGTNHSLALATDGTVYAWGGNSAGQLGDNTTTQHIVPAPVRNPTDTANLTGIVAIAAGPFFSLAVAADGTVYAWGNNANGQLGDTTLLDRHLPVVVVGIGGIGTLNLGACAVAGANCAVAAGGAHSLAKAADGRVFAWGFNADGQLGDTTTTTRTAPVAVLPVTGAGQLNARSVDAGVSHSVALAADGTVVAWGASNFGQVGDGTTTDHTRPTNATLAATGAPLTGIAAVAAGYLQNLALTTSGSLFAWGNNATGQLGDGTTGNRTRAVPVLNLAGITAIAAGVSHSLAIGPDFPYATVTPQPTATPYVYTPPPTSAGTLFLTSPIRVVDTRASEPPGVVHLGFDETGAPIPVAPLPAGAVRRFRVAGQTFPAFTFPASVKGLQLNLTVVTTSGTGAGGFLTVFPGDVPDAARPLGSALNPVTPVAFNLWSTPLPLAPAANPGTFAAYSSTVPLDLIVDVTGYYQ